MITNENNFEQKHEINWYVYRNKGIREELYQLWNKGKGIKDKKTMDGADIDQKICHSANILFHKIEKNGPVQTEYANYHYDKRNDLFHAHIWKGKITYVVIWEADEEKKIVNIVNIAKHENFNYQRKHSKKNSIEEAERFREQDRKYADHKLFQQSAQVRKRRRTDNCGELTLPPTKVQRTQGK